MFCVHCGVENPDIGSFCRRCGKALVKDDFEVHAPEVTETVHSERPEQPPAGVSNTKTAEPKPVQPERGKQTPTPMAKVTWLSKVTWLYVGLGLELTMAALLLVLFAWAFTMQLMVGTPETIGDILIKPVIPLLFIAFSMKRTWAAILDKEPENVYHFQQSHRRMQRITTWTVAACVTLAVIVGFIQGNKIVEQHQSLVRLMSQMEATSQQVAAFTNKLAEIRQKQIVVVKQGHEMLLNREKLSEAERLGWHIPENAEPFYAYGAQCDVLDKLLPEGRELLDKRDKLFEAFASETKDDPAYVLVASRTRPIFAKDREFIDLLEREIGFAKNLMQLPPSRRAGYYHEKIEPLETRIGELAAEETMMVQQAKSRAAQ